MPKIIIVIVISILLWQLGFFTRYNYVSAFYDSNFGTPRVITTSPQPKIELVPFRSLGEKYGLYVVNKSCLLSSSEINGIDIYSTIISKHLSKKNGNNWRTNYMAELDSIAKEYPIK